MGYSRVRLLGEVADALQALESQEDGSTYQALAEAIAEGRIPHVTMQF